MLKTLTAGCAGIAVVLLWLSGGGPVGPGAEVELAAAGQDREFSSGPTRSRSRARSGS